jgi:hypothetical protein
LPPRPAASRTAHRTTKAQVLSGAKAAVDAGEDLRHTAERLACAQEDFHASQREIGRAVGRSASWVNRLLEWRRSGYKQGSAFGPTTRAGRAAHRNINNNDFGRRGGADSLLFGAAATGPNYETSSPHIRKDGQDDGDVSQVERCSASYQPSSLSAPGNENLTSGSTQPELPPSETAAGEDEGRKAGRSGSSPLGKQTRPSENVKANQMRSPERMRIVLRALRECPTYVHAAAEAGIHRKTRGLVET